MVTDDSVVDGLLASTLVDVAWMAEAVNVHRRIRVPGFPAEA
jgi:glutamine phosphoribosylpyrophosphate amidotransferase